MLVTFNSANTMNCTPKKRSKIAFKGITPLQIKGKETFAKIFTGALDYKTMSQIKDICNHPVFENTSIRIMPDVHPGKNCIVGFSSTVGAKGVIPSIIGSDIGCGMLCVKFDTQGKEIDFRKLDDVVRTYFSMARTKKPAWVKKVIPSLRQDIESMCPKFRDTSADYQIDNLGTVGRGNHFIEIDKDSKGQQYLIIHTGSRALGKRVADYHEFVARHQNHYYIRELSYLSRAEAAQYLKDLNVTQRYAAANRRVIADEILYRMGWKEKGSFESIHNYISPDGIIRKGAIEATKGKQVLIPLNMRDGAILGRGKGNVDWNQTAPHGAGRCIARGEAMKTLSVEDYKNSMQGIFTTSVSKDTLDEAPAAYKKASEIISNIEDTVQVDEILKPLYNFKD